MTPWTEQPCRTESHGKVDGMTFRPKALLVAIAFLVLLALSLKQIMLPVIAVAAGVALEMMMWRGVFSRR